MSSLDDTTNLESRLPRADADIKDEIARRVYFDRVANSVRNWKARNMLYHDELTRICLKLIPPKRTVLEIGCGTGDLLAALNPIRGIGVDCSPKMLELARQHHPNLTFVESSAEELSVREKFDFIVMSDVVGSISDIWRAFRELEKACNPDTRVIITYYNYLWQPLFRLGERLGLKISQPIQNWLPMQDLVSFLDLAGFETVKTGHQLLCPVNIPLVATLCNRFLAFIPGLERLCVQMYVVARQKSSSHQYSVSVIVPCRNEAGNIDELIERIPNMGKGTEIIFVDGASNDGTADRVEAASTRLNGRKDIKLLREEVPRGKAAAVHRGFHHAQGEILMILDADLSVQPEDLLKFYLALSEGHAEFVNGSRMVYAMDARAMRLLNLLGNKLFCVLVSWLMGQRVRDTLCGTKVFFRKHYNAIMSVRNRIGTIDPFGDFELLFGASWANLKIVEIPIRYRERKYGETKISRFRHGWQLLRMCLNVLYKLKFA